MGKYLNIHYNEKIEYSELLQIILDHYKDLEINLSSMDADKLKNKLISEDITQPLFIINDEQGEIKFDISKEDIKKIIEENNEDENCKLIEVTFGEMIELKYEIKTEDKEKTQDDNLQIIINSQNELLNIEREKRKFTILQKNRALDEAEKEKNKTAIVAGICALSTIAAILYKQDINQLFKIETNTLNSWESLKKYFHDIGPFTTTVITITTAFINKYFKKRKKYKQAKNELYDLDKSLENNETTGSKIYVKTK